MEGRRRQRQAEPASQSQAGKRDTEPHQKRKKELNKERVGGRKGPLKKSGMHARVRAPLLCPAPSKTSSQHPRAGLCWEEGQAGTR